MVSKNPSLQRLYNGFRGILCDGIMVDYDMCNAHPRFLLNLCNKYDLVADKLLYYIKNRDDCLAELVNNYDICRGQAKAYYLKCINKIDLTTKINNKKIKKNSFFLEFDIQLKNIIKSLYSIFRKDEKYKKHKSNEWNKQGKLVNLVLCDLENEYLNEAINELVKNNVMKREDIGVLMFDGFMAYNKNKDDVIKFLNAHFKERHIEWDYKEHNIELLEYLNKLDEDGELLKIDNFNGTNIIEVVNHMLNNILKNKLYKDDNNYYYLTNECIITKEKMIKSNLYDLVSQQSYTFFDEYKGRDGAIVSCSKIPKHIDNIVKGVMDKCPTNRDFINNIWNFTQFKLFFLNGYYDFNKKEFVKNSECGNSNKTFIKINKKFKKSNNPELRKLIEKKIFHPIFTIKDDNDKERIELYNYFKYSTAHYLAGDISLKRWSLFTGLRNSGKGIIGDLLKNCFEKYVMTTNSGNFNFKKNITDSQKALSWLIDYQFCRIALTSEIAVYDDVKLDGNMIKKFTSGGDCIMARKNFQDEIEFKIQSGLIVCCNDIPPIEPIDAMEFCDEYDMKSKFIDKTFDNENKIKGYSYYEKDNDLKHTFLQREDIITELMNIFIESYDKECEFPEAIRKDNQINNMEDDNYTIIKDVFILTNNETDKLSNKKIKEICKNNNITSFTHTKIKKLLKTMGATDYRDCKSRGLCGIKCSLLDDDGEPAYDSD